MGLPRAAVHLLIDESRRTKWSGDVASLGRQHVYLDFAQLKLLADKRGYELPAISHSLHRDPELRAQGFLSDDSLFELLGFQQSFRIDHSNYEEAEIQLDLNLQETPEALRNRFDLVLDSGTIEHVFQIGHALKHCLEMAKPGGRIVHLTPSSNAVNHGLYSASPTLFADFYRSCGCQVERLWLCRLGRDFIQGTWNVYDCLSSDRNWLPLGRLDGAVWLTYAVILKTAGARARTPQQSFYVDTWDASQAVESENGNGLSRDRAGKGGGAAVETPSSLSKSERLLRASSKWPWLNAMCRAAIARWRQLIGVLRERRRGAVPYRFVGRY